MRDNQFIPIEAVEMAAAYAKQFGERVMTPSYNLTHQTR